MAAYFNYRHFAKNVITCAAFILAVMLVLNFIIKFYVKMLMLYNEAILLECANPFFMLIF